MRYRREDVVARALEVLDEYGLADLTMRRLGAELGVQPSALYHHFPNKQSLLAAVADEILVRGARPLPEREWDEQVRAACERLRDSCLAYRDEAPADVTGAGATLCYVVELVDEQLTVQPIHRLVSGLPAGTDLPAALGAVYEVEPVGPDGSVEPGQLGLVTGGAVHRLRPRTDDGTLDTVRLDEALAALPPHDLAFQHGVANVHDAVATGRADAGVLLRPVTVEQISAVADEGERMPPKTTFFWPKPRTGIVFRSLR